MFDHKDRIKKAIERHSKREAKKLAPKKPRGPNKRPEEESVKEIKAWCKRNNIQVHRYESKAKWNADAGMYLSDAVEPGHPDLAGCNEFGVGVYIEVKAKKKRYSARPGQLEFLKKKIVMNCFACVADSSEYLDYCYKRWLSIKGLKDKRDFLFGQLPFLREDDGFKF